MSPVIDHEVHPLTRQDDSARYGCHGKSRIRPPLKVQAGYESIGTANKGGKWVHRVIQIEDHGSLECRYDRSLGDPKCNGCQHRGSGEAYSESVQGGAK